VAARLPADIAVENAVYSIKIKQNNNKKIIINNNNKHLDIIYSAVM